MNDAIIAAKKVSDAAETAAAKVANAAMAAANVLALAAHVLEAHVEANGDRITALEKAVIAHTEGCEPQKAQVAEVLDIVRTLKLGGKFLTWLSGFAILLVAVLTYLK